IHIPTVHNLFRFLRRDAMFDLNEVIGTTAFFTRTSAPAFDPLGDGWWQQKYNARPLLRYTWRDESKNLLPGSLRKRAARLKRRAWQGSRGASVEILAPGNGGVVADAGPVGGSAMLPPDSFLWVLARRKDFPGWWPQGTGAVRVDGNRWKASVTYGGPQDG